MVSAAGHPRTRMTPHWRRPNQQRCAFRRALVLAAGLLAAAASGATPPPRPFLSPIFGDDMVLQRGKPNAFWGWTQPGAEVRVVLAGRSDEARADGSGRWLVRIQAPPAGGPYDVRVEGPGRAVLHNVLCGDVWLCGGQSNMVFPLAGADGGKAEAAAAHHPLLRFFTVKDRSADAPAEEPEGRWVECTPESAAQFSAVGYFFARRIQKDVPIPIGLIQVCVGGSPAESWMSGRALAALGEFGPQLAEIERFRSQGLPESGSFLMHWLAEYDSGGRGDRWAQPGFDDHGWKEVPVPGGLAALGVAATPAVCWFRRDFTLPDPVPAGNARVLLGSVDKMDTTYINGRWVGASSWVEHGREYPIPAGLLRPGRNRIAVRVFKLGAHGGFISGPGALRIELGDGTSVPLAGTWRGRVSVDARPPHPLPLDFENYPTMPTVLFNGMLAPLAPLALTGAIWYQGEANWTHPAQYRRLLPALIADWRRTFGQGEFPFYIVGLPAFNARRTTPGPDGWTEIREAQDETAREVPNAAIAVTVDTGEAGNIHPTQKRPVGERLAADALALHYGIKVPFAGPTFASLQRLPGALRIHFDHAEGGLVVHGPRLGEFSVAGADRVWHWAEAKIEGSAVVVRCKDVPAPVAARYAWQANPLASLFNGAGLPAEPFRTDSWPE